VSGPDLRERIAVELGSARQRSLDLLDPLSEPDLVRQISPIMSPLVWDLAHVGNYEDLWLLRAAVEAPPVDATVDDLYDAFRHPRPNRPALPLLGPVEARRYIGEVRSRVLDTLDEVPLDDGDRPLVADGFVYGMVIQHEHQHDETMLATLQLSDGEPLLEPGGILPPGTPVPEEVWVPPGPFVMGTDDDPWAYDNEQPAHVVDLDGYWIDAAPVTNGQYLAFMADGGYERPELWTPEGWAWCREASLAHPEFWSPDGGRWSLRRFGRGSEVRAEEPVEHVCWYEADAYARWAGKRLPSEAEWEKAASWSPDGRKRRYPWGDAAPTPRRANLDQRLRGPAPVGAYPGGVSAYGCHQLVGDVWEWTASEFATYPRFEAFPYREYSEVFSGSGYRVLRGGSWATSPLTVRTTFRNWDHPIRRQIFAGFRCARGTTR